MQVVPHGAFKDLPSAMAGQSGPSIVVRRRKAREYRDHL
jgi:hypothetical protein